MIGSNVKALVIYDCCREPFEELREKIKKALEIMKNKTGESQSDQNLKPLEFKEENISAEE